MVYDPSRNSEVFARLLEQCRPLIFPPPWHFLDPAPDCYALCADADAMLAALRQDFDDQRLVEARVLAPTTEGIMLNAALRTDVLLVIRQKADGLPTELMTRSGCLSDSSLPVQAAFQDAQLMKDLARIHYLFVTFEPTEVALLRALGLPAALAAGLDRTKVFHLRWLERTFNARRRFTPILVIAGWSLLGLRREVPAALAGCARHLRNAAQYLPLDDLLRGVWRPTPDQLDELRFLVTMQDRDCIRSRVLELVSVLEEVEAYTGAHKLRNP